MKTLLACFAAVVLLVAQEGNTVNQFQGPPNRGTEQLLYYSGSNLQYRCVAFSNTISAYTFAVSAGTNASPVSFTYLGGFDYQSGNTQLPTVAISGGSGAWSAVNGLWVATPTSSTTFTIPVDSTTFGAFQASIVFRTQAPRTTSAIWSVQKFVYDGSSNLIFAGWAGNPAGAGSSTGSSGSSAMNFVCANRATLSYQ